jgi:16S rRNA (guanine527-N7)-methyltransferase
VTSHPSSVTPDDLAARLRGEAAAVGVELTDRQTAQLSRFLRLISRWRRAAALTAVADPLQAARVHVADSLVCLRAGIPERASLIDVGSGAGFPGIPLAVVRSDLSVTLLEASQRKAGFLERAVADLGLEVQVIAGRAEEAAAQPAAREGFDVVAARAVGSLPTLVELTLPLARVGGLVVLLKGPEIREELDSARRAIEVLGGDAPSVVEASLRGGERRTIVVVPKGRPTPHGYPRRAGVPHRHPL